MCACLESVVELLVLSCSLACLTLCQSLASVFVLCLGPFGRRSNNRPNQPHHNIYWSTCPDVAKSPRMMSLTILLEAAEYLDRRERGESHTRVDVVIDFLSPCHLPSLPLFSLTCLSCLYHVSGGDIHKLTKSSIVPLVVSVK